jgi:hypothetical protein
MKYDYDVASKHYDMRTAEDNTIIVLHIGRMMQCCSLPWTEWSDALDRIAYDYVEMEDHDYGD